MKLVLVHWRDAFEEHESQGPPQRDYIVQTVGFLIGDGPIFLSVAQEVLPDGEGYRSVTNIPLPNVVSRTIFKE